jgi:rod shape-determining protein MreB and related proteins
VIKFSKVKGEIVKLLTGFSWDIGIDLGSSNTRIYLKDRGIVIEEPTMLVRQRKKRWAGLSAPKSNFKMPIAFGFKAKEMLNREPKQIEVISPIRNGIITDLESLESLITYYLKLIYEIPSGYPKIFKPRLVVGVPSCINQVQKRAFRSIFLKSGVREVVLIESSVLSAIGLGLPIDSSAGLVLVDIGGGKTEVSVISMGGVVIGRGIKTAGDDFDENIVSYVKMKYGILIGTGSAERIKISMGSRGNDIGLVRGRDLETGLPRSVRLTADEIKEAVALEMAKIVKLVSSVLDETPPELMEDILKRGIVLVGNGSQIEGMSDLIESKTKIFVRLVDDGGLAVVRGCGELVQNRNLLNRVKLVSGV